MITVSVIQAISDWLTLGALILLALCVLAYLLHRLRKPLRWIRIHLSLPERRTRLMLQVPAGHPERVAGSDQAAKRQYFRRLAKELADEGIVAMDIIKEDWGSV